MRKIREILRLRIGQQLSEREVSKSCGVGKTTVRDCVSRFKVSGLVFPLDENMDDFELESRLYPRKSDGPRNPSLPDWSKIHLELKRKGVTRHLLWEEYLEQNQETIGYSRFCELYQGWLKKSRISMRQNHKAGEKLFVDFAGTTVPVFDPLSGAKQEAQIFVATWGASNFTYAQAVWSQDLQSWTSCHAGAFEYFGCVPHILVPDNLKSGVKSPCRYDPDINETYLELAEHYDCAIIPAHIYKPKHKAKVEFGVLLVTRWILAKLRKRKFFSLDELNEAILELLEDLNRKPFQKIPGSRSSVFSTLDKPSAKPLPQARYTYAEVKKAKVNIDYHIVIDDHFYSVPYSLQGETMRVRLTSNTVEIFHKQRRICSHLRGYKKWGFTTLEEHMPKSHREYLNWNPSRIINWAEKSGPETSNLVERLLKE